MCVPHPERERERIMYVERMVYFEREIRWIFLGWVSRNFEEKRERERDRDFLAQDSDSFNKLKTL